MITALCIMGLTAGNSRSQSNPLDEGNAGFDIFYSNLAPYGEWVNVDYGQAWRPYHVGRGWRPYMNGRWLWTDDGWYWSSYEPFGWAVYHYGRWTYDDYYGWIWLPDNVWGPAWVDWRYNDDYIGWAPLPPAARFSFGIGITFGERWNAPVHYWNFVPCRSFTAARINDYVTPIDRSRRFFGSTREHLEISGNGDRVINRGIDPGFIERRGNLHIERSDVITTDHDRGERVVRENDRNRVEVYRPHIDNPAAGDRSVGRMPPGNRNNSQGRSYNEMQGNRPVNQMPAVRGRVRQPAQPSPRPAQPQIERRSGDNRRAVETPERWRQKMPEQRPMQPAIRQQQQSRGAARQPETGKQTPARESGRNGRR